MILVRKLKRESLSWKKCIQHLKTLKFEGTNLIIHLRGSIKATSKLRMDLTIEIGTRRNRTETLKKTYSKISNQPLSQPQMSKFVHLIYRLYPSINSLFF